MSKFRFARLAAVSFVLFETAVSHAAYIYHTTTTSSIAQSTATSKNLSTKKQQLIYDPAVAGSFNPVNTYIVSFQGFIDWDGPVTFNSFAPDPQGTYTPGCGCEGGFTPVVTANSVTLEGFYGGSSPHAPIPVYLDQNLITATFDVTGPGVVNYSVNLTQLVVEDFSDPANPVLYTLDSTNTIFLGAQTTVLPEPNCAAIFAAGASMAALRRRRSVLSLTAKS